MDDCYGSCPIVVGFLNCSWPSASEALALQSQYCSEKMKSSQLILSLSSINNICTYWLNIWDHKIDKINDFNLFFLFLGRMIPITKGRHEISKKNLHNRILGLKIFTQWKRVNCGFLLKIKPCKFQFCSYFSSLSCKIFHFRDTSSNSFNSVHNGYSILARYRTKLGIPGHESWIRKSNKDITNAIPESK